MRAATIFYKYKINKIFKAEPDRLHPAQYSNSKFGMRTKNMDPHFSTKIWHILGLFTLGFIEFVHEGRILTNIIAQKLTSIKFYINFTLIF